jgi:hypothetical protein
MPCYDSQARDAELELQTANQKLRTRVDQLARIACTFAGVLEAIAPCGLNELIEGPDAKEALDWWSAHKEFDAAKKL